MRDWRERFRQQNSYEAEGAAAGLDGKTRADCPYSSDTKSEAWNFWVYGCEAAAGEKRTLESGSITFCTTSPTGPTFTYPVDEAIRIGLWKPKWANFDAPTFSITGKSS